MTTKRHRQRWADETHARWVRDPNNPLHRIYQARFKHPHPCAEPDLTGMTTMQLSYLKACADALVENEVSSTGLDG